MRQPDLFRVPKKPWNAGRIIAPKGPLKPKHIRAIRQRLKTSGWVRDLVRLSVSDVASSILDTFAWVGSRRRSSSALRAFAFSIMRELLNVGGGSDAVDRIGRKVDRRTHALEVRFALQTQGQLLALRCHRTVATRAASWEWKSSERPPSRRGEPPLPARSSMRTLTILSRGAKQLTSSKH